MLTLGRRPEHEDIVGLLLDCHQRIRQFTALARTLGEKSDVTPEQVADAAARVRRYFAQALPLHAEDEERSILPRLRGRDAALDQALDAMAREHGYHAEPLAELLELCDILVEHPDRHAELMPRVARTAAQLDAHFTAHLAAEESIVFPAIPRYLDEPTRAAMVRELRGRRQAA